MASKAAGSFGMSTMMVSLTAMASTINEAAPGALAGRQQGLVLQVRGLADGDWQRYPLGAMKEKKGSCAKFLNAFSPPLSKQYGPSLPAESQ